MEKTGKDGKKGWGRKKDGMGTNMVGSNGRGMLSLARLLVIIVSGLLGPRISS
jgi:hypothetical protein